jgi:oxazoline/thiazoline dehydrogenase
VDGPAPARRTLLRRAARASGRVTPPQVLVTLAARFRRVSWQYSGIAYALILKDAGALIQTMYLVATALGLAPCALGSGDSDLFAQATGEDYYEETSVAELMLGSAPTGEDGG